MTRRFPLLLGLLAAVLCLWSLTANADTTATPRHEAPIVIAAGTSLVADIVNDLGGGHMTASAIMPAAACPGHTDLRASDMRTLDTAAVILLHDWQTHLDSVMGPIRNDPALVAKVRVVSATGNWMVPERQQAATLAIADVMADLDAPHAALYRKRAKARVADVTEVATRLRAKAAPLKELPVMADAQQVPLLAFFGCKVAARYGRFEETGPKKLAAALAGARAAGVRLVVDNLQSSGGSGKTFAGDLDAAYAVLSNFPGAMDGAPTWAETISVDLDRCLAALKGHGR